MHCPRPSDSRPRYRRQCRRLPSPTCWARASGDWPASVSAVASASRSTSQPVGCHGIPRSITFCAGRTKKIAFAAGLDEIPFVPVQAMTASLYGALTLCGLWLFFKGLHAWVIPASITSSQAWRVYSEGFHADYRGPGDLSAYQVMAGITAALGAFAPLSSARSGVAAARPRYSVAPSCDTYAPNGMAGTLFLHGPQHSEPIGPTVPCPD